MRGRFEALITVPSPGWSVSATNGAGGPTTVTVPATTYSFTSLCSAFQTQLNTSRPNGWTVSFGGGEGGTGLVTLNCSSTNWSITWTSTDLRDALGYSGDIAARASSLAADRQSYLIWMPDCPYWAPLDLTLESGLIETDLRQAESPDGRVKTLYGNQKTVVEGLRWDAISQNKARNISTTVTGFQKFWSTALLGGVSYTVVGSFVYFYPNADSASNNRYKIVGLRNSKYPMTVSGWAGCYRIEIPRMVIS